MSRHIKLIANFMTVGLWTLISRITGLAREIIFAALFGASPTAEAFQVAFALPNMFRRFFAEGAFNMAFIPLFSKKYQAGKGAQAFANDAFNTLGMLLIILSLIATLIMPWLVLLMAAGFAGDTRLALATEFGRICFPYIFFISLAALCNGVLNSAGRFAVAAGAPVLLNIILGGGMMLAYWLGANPVHALVFGVPIAGAAQLALVWRATNRLGIKIRPAWPRWSPELKTLALIAAPAALSGGVVQVNLLVGRFVASFDPGAIQWLALADRLYQFPLGMVGVAIGVVLLPKLSRQLQENDVQGGRDSFNRATEFALFLTLPSSFALAMLALPLISVIFERGALLPSDSLAAAHALSIYALGLPAFVLQKIYQPLFFARGDTKTPFYYALIAMIFNLVIAVGFAFWWGYLAAASATSLSAWVMLFLLWRGAGRHLGRAADFDTGLKQRVLRIGGATSVMAIVLYFAHNALADMLYQNTLRYGALFILIMLGGISYFLAAYLLGAFKVAELRQFLRHTK